MSSAPARRRKLMVVAGTACLSVVVWMPTAGATSARSPVRAVAHLQLRPVLARVAPASAPAAESSAANIAAVAACDPMVRESLGKPVPTTKVAKVRPEACVVLPAQGDATTRYLLGPAELDATAVRRSRARFVSGAGWVVELTFTPRGSAAFDALGARQLHHQVAIVADGVVVAAPTIEPADQTFSSFGGTVQISGQFSSKAAKRLATSVNQWRHTG
jgi:preprotein translocase subunit SecD